MAGDTIWVIVVFNERRIRGEWITALSAEEMVGVVVAAQSHDGGTFDWCFTIVTTWREELVIVEMTEKLEVVIALDEILDLWVVRLKVWHECVDTIATSILGFRIEGDTFETC